MTRPRVPDAEWVRSRHDGGPGGQLELARFPDGNIAIRHSHDPDGIWLLLGGPELRAFIAGAKAGDFDHLARSGPVPGPPRPQQ